MTTGPFSAYRAPFPGLADDVVVLEYFDAARPDQGLQVAVDPWHGSNVISLQKGNFREGSAFEILHLDISRLVNGDFTGNFPMFPYVNRYANKAADFGDGRVVDLSDISRVRGGPLLVHGVVYDQPWESSEPEATSSSAAVTTFIDFSPGHAHFGQFPFPCRLEVRFTLTEEGLRQDHTVHNLGHDEFGFGMGWHPFFKRIGEDSETFLCLPAERLLEVNNDPDDPNTFLVPTGRTHDVETYAGGKYSLTSPRPLSELSDFDTFYTGMQPGRTPFIYYGSVTGTGGTLVEMRTDAKHQHGVVYTQEPEFFCMEVTTAPADAHNLAQRGLAELANLTYVQLRKSVTNTAGLYVSIGVALPR